MAVETTVASNEASIVTRLKARRTARRFDGSNRGAAGGTSDTAPSSSHAVSPRE
jgi:hypothetical protein